MPANLDYDSDFDRVLEQAAHAWQQEHEMVAPHPNTDTLIAYQKGSLSSADADRVQRHVSSCVDCHHDLRALEAFDEEPAAEVLDDPEMQVLLNAGWETFEAQRRASSTSTPPTRTRWSLHTILPLAASLVFAVVGVTGFLLSTPTPSGAPMVFDVRPDGDRVERSAEPSRIVPVPLGVHILVPRISIGDQTPFESYELVLSRADGREVARLDDAVRDPQGRFAFSISRWQVPNGSYRLTLVGIEAGRRTEIAAYSFVLRDAE